MDAPRSSGPEKFTATDSCEFTDSGVKLYSETQSIESYSAEKDAGKWEAAGKTATKGQRRGATAAEAREHPKVKAKAKAKVEARSCRPQQKETDPMSMSRKSKNKRRGESKSTKVQSQAATPAVDHSGCDSKADLVNLLESTIGKQNEPPAASRPQPPMDVDSGAMAAAFPHTHMFTDMFSQASTRASSEDSIDFPENWANRIKIICERYPSAPRSQVISLLKKHHGAACVAVHELQEIIHAKEEKARQNAERQAEIAMQDQEYHESLLMDQRQQMQRQEEEAAERALAESRKIQQAKEAEELKLQQEKEAEASREAEIVFEAKRARVEQPEADKSHPDRCQLVIRTPSGKRLTRTFLRSDEVSLIYDWIDVSCAQDDFVMETYRLVARLPGMPNKELCRSQQSLQQEGVEHGTAFMVSSNCA